MRMCCSQDDVKRLFHSEELCLTPDSPVLVAYLCLYRADTDGITLPMFTIYYHALAARCTGVAMEREGLVCSASDVWTAVSGEFHDNAPPSLPISDIPKVFRMI